jgi:hypothetical protein
MGPEMRRHRAHVMGDKHALAIRRKCQHLGITHVSQSSGVSRQKINGRLAA